MDIAKRQRLKAAGWCVGDAADFLKLSSEEKDMVMIEEWVYNQPDFAAQLKAITQPRTGLRSPLRQGLKLDFMYEGDEGIAWMIYYALLDSKANLLPQDVVCEDEVIAYFRVLNPELWIKVHQQRIKPGTKFYVVVGSHKVAEGIVTELLRGS